MLVIALSGLSLTACSDDDLSTNQYEGGVQLNVYGPNPVMRGGVLRFIGSNLDQIAQVIIPGCDPITNIEVISTGKPSEIRVTLPKDGPEVGYVKLIAKDGTELVTKTQLEYEEPIVFDSFAPEAVMPGDEITIEGDYLNLVQMVCFEDEVYVSADDFVSQDRYKIVLVVPEEAQTGVIGLYTMDLTKVENPAAETGYNIIESENILEVGTPSVTKFASPRGEAQPMGAVQAKAGETITVTGTFFNLVSGFAIKGEAVTVNGEAVSVNDEGTEVTFTLPDDAPDGTIVLICKSGVEVPVGTVNTVEPTNLAAAPSPVKNGATLTITGENLDLIKEVYFPNVGDAVAFEYEKAITVTVPELAQEGDITLKMENGKEVTVAYTLVKPVVTAYRANPVNAGAQEVLTGTDLDLVKSITFGDADNDADKIEIAQTSITVTVPMAAKSGAPVLNLINGTTVEAPELTIEEALFCYISVFPDEETEIKAGTSMNVTVVNGDKLTGVQIDGTDCQWILTGEDNDQLIIGVPNTAGSGSEIKLISSNGEYTAKYDFIPASSVKKSLFSGLKELTWNDGGRIMIPASAFQNVPAGAEMTIAYSQIDQQWGCAQFNYGNWSGANFIADGEYSVSFNQTLVPTDLYGWFSDGILDRETTVTISQENLDNFQALKGDCEDQTDCALIIQGQNLIVSSITLTYEISSEKSLADCMFRTDDNSQQMSLPVHMAWDDSGRFWLFSRPGNTLESAKLKAGQSVIKFYVEGTGQIQINDNDWNTWTSFAEWNDPAARVDELVLTQDMIDCLKDSGKGMVIQGDGVTVSKISLLP